MLENEQGINVLSLFDGMSCGRIALERAGVKIKNYYASEIDKYAIAVAKKNYPDTIHLGDVRNVKSENLPKIDLLIGGSPCQGFSFAGKQLNFDDPRSKLFFEFVRLNDELLPDYFMLENVRMKKESQNIISKYLGVKPIKINSNLVSGQNRLRLYWSNVGGIQQPTDKHIYLKHILQNDVSEKYNLTDKAIRRIVGSSTYKTKILSEVDKAVTIGAQDYVKLARGMNVVLGSVKTDRTEKAKRIRRENMLKGVDYSLFSEKEINRIDLDKTGTITTRSNDNIIIDTSYQHEGLRFYKDKSPTITARDYKEPKRVYKNYNLRKLTPLECERLQTVPDGYTEGVSDTQRYKMLGNGWTVDVVAHIFQNLPYSLF